MTRTPYTRALLLCPAPDRALACKEQEAAGLGLTGLCRTWEEFKIHDMKAVVLVGGLKLNFDVPTWVHALSREDHDHARIMLAANLARTAEMFRAGAIWLPSTRIFLSE